MSERQKLKLPFTNMHGGSIKLHGPYGLNDQGYLNPEKNPMHHKNVAARKAARLAIKQANKKAEFNRNSDALRLANERTRFLEEQALSEVAPVAEQTKIGALATEPVEQNRLNERGMVLLPDEVSSLRVAKD